MARYCILVGKVHKTGRGLGRERVTLGRRSGLLDGAG